MNYEEWKETVRKGCPQSKYGGQGQDWCNDGGVTAYCDMHGCPRLRDK